MKNLKGTKTELNLANAFAGESQARNRYTYFASVAKKEGYEQISALFIETANNEKEHAELFYKHIGDGHFDVKSNYPFLLGSTAENLKFSADGEHEEWSKLYFEASIIAKEEGFDEISDTFKQVLEAEKHHELRFRTLLKNVEESLVFKRPTQVLWICRNCGRIIKSTQAPEQCPTCKHPKSYFELLCDNF